MNTKEVKAILVIILGLLTFYAYLHFFKDQDASALLYTALGIGIISLAIPMVGKGIVWLWFKLGTALGWINSKILLTILFFLILTPLSKLHQLFKKDSLLLKAPQKSTFESRDDLYEPKDLDHPW